MTTSTTKTQFLLFPPNYSSILPFTEKILLIDYSLFNSTSAKYLGIKWDYKLNWSYHVQNLLERGHKLINLMRAISAHSRGCHPEILLMILKGLVIPTIEWGNTLHAQADKNLLENLTPFKMRLFVLSPVAFVHLLLTSFITRRELILWKQEDMIV